jgi:hypothetical protein
MVLGFYLNKRSLSSSRNKNPEKNPQLVNHPLGNRNDFCGGDERNGETDASRSPETSNG